MSMNNDAAEKRRFKRIRLAEIAVTLLCVWFCGSFGWKYLVHPSFFEEGKGLKNSIIHEAISGYAIEGDVVDIDGSLIYGGAAKGKNASADYPKNLSYAWLLGYYTVTDGTENGYGLLGNLRDYSHYWLDENNKGATTTLTTDNRLQNYAYELLNNKEGSIIVLDNKTGAIKAFASHSTIQFNVNDIDTLITSDVPNSQFRRGTFENDPPGSTFKVITAAAAYQMAEETGIDESTFDYFDEGYYYAEGSDWKITNFENLSYGQLNLETALNKSVNTYFAHLGNLVGMERLEKMALAFQLGKTIEIPFLSTFKSKIDMSDHTPDTVAHTAFGQGNTEVTPMNMALVAQAIANDGKMMSPYIVKRIASQDQILYTYKERQLAQCLDLTVDEKLKKIMHSTAEGYGLTENRLGMVYAKTGTAECADGRTHTYLIGFTDDYSFCISMNDGDLSSKLYRVAYNLVNFMKNNL